MSCTTQQRQLPHNVAMELLSGKPVASSLPQLVPWQCTHNSRGPEVGQSQPGLIEGICIGAPAPQPLYWCPSSATLAPLYMLCLRSIMGCHLHARACMGNMYVHLHVCLTFSCRLHSSSVGMVWPAGLRCWQWHDGRTAVVGAECCWPPLSSGA